MDSWEDYIGSNGRAEWEREMDLKMSNILNRIIELENHVDKLWEKVEMEEDDTENSKG